ncbi:MAG: DoxX family protein [Phycisphaerae bacterium]|jgi:uncharacterized membrane protein YphA (DoxX/SURF4 family)
MGERRSILGRIDNVQIPLSALIRIFLGGYFLYTGVVKAIDPPVFLKGIHTYGFMPTEPPILINATAVILPWLEIICGSALLLGLWIRGAALSIGVMLLVFTPAILVRGLQIMAADGISFLDVKFDCGCGTGVEITWIKICKNTGLLLLAVLALLSHSRRFTVDRFLDRVRSAAKFCRSCGHPLHGAPGLVCPSCRDASRVPSGTPDAAS